MARPRKTRLDYFPFDVDFFEDEKIVCIAGEFGIKGEITAIRLLCAVYRNGYFILWTEQLKMKMLRQMPGVSSELFDQILNRLVRWGFFDASLFDSVKVLTSVGIQRRYFEATKFRISNEDLPYILIKDEIKNYSKKDVSQKETGVSQKETPVSQQEIPQIKRNEIIIISPSNEGDMSAAGATDIASEPEIDLKKLMSFFNQQVATNNSTIPKITSLSEERRKYIKCRIREYGKEAFIKVVKYAVTSDFLNGKNNRNFIATFDWIIRPRNFPKVLEGNYNNSNHANPTSYQQQQGGFCSKLPPVNLGCGLVED